MSAAVADPERASKRLRQYLRWAVLPGPTCMLVLLGLYLLVGSPIVLVLLATVGLNTMLQAGAYRLAGARRVDAAVLLLAVGLWTIAIAASLGGLKLFSITATLAVLPVVAGLAYASLPNLRRMILLSTLVVALGGVIMLGAPFSLHQIPEVPLNLIVGSGVTMTVAACAFSLWHARFTLDDARSGLQRTHWALQRSERVLEERVQRRSDELRLSQRELTAARDEALAANRHKSAFLANMSHELRTPLNAIIGFSEALVERYFGELNAKQAEYTQDINESGRHLLHLINAILDLSKIEAGQLRLSHTILDVCALVEGAVEQARPRAAQRAVTIAVELDPATGSVEADRPKLQQVLHNLLSNAVKFTARGGAVTVRAASSGTQHVEVSVADTGIGIAPEDHQAIFEAFHRWSGDHARQQQGSGLGLALAKALVELHGGRMWLRSELGKGSTFHFTLPRTAGVRGGVIRRASEWPRSSS